MGRWLGKIQNEGDSTPSKPTKSPLEGLEGEVGAAFSEKTDVDPLAPSQLVEWIEEHCPLLPEDKTHIVRGLYRLHPKRQAKLAQWYVSAWRMAAESEPRPVKKENAGRRAANLIVTRLMKGGGQIDP